jgi:hypothetical protein
MKLIRSPWQRHVGEFRCTDKVYVPISLFEALHFQKLFHRDITIFEMGLCKCPQGESNPCFGLERATSWAARRWGLKRWNNTTRLPERQQFHKFETSPVL